MNLLLDTNAWSYVAQEEALPELLRVSVKRKIRLLIAPASVTEARAVKDPSRRKAVLAVMTDPRLTRLMPETFLESQDIKETLLAARPAWANPKPDASDFLRNRHYWRMSSAYQLRSELKIYASPYREWIDCHLDVHAMMADFDDFNRVWFCEVRPEQLQRTWLRASMEYLQRWHKPTDGSPADSQLATHLVDADYFVTADKNFARCVEKIQSEAPFKSAKVLKIRGGAEGLKELIEFCQSRA